MEVITPRYFNDILNQEADKMKRFGEGTAAEFRNVTGVFYIHTGHCCVIPDSLCVYRLAHRIYSNDNLNNYGITINSDINFSLSTRSIMF